MSDIIVKVGDSNDIRVVSSFSGSSNEIVVSSSSNETIVSSGSDQSKENVVSSVSGSAGGIAVAAENLIGGDALVKDLFVTGLSTFIGTSLFKDDIIIDGNIVLNGNINIPELQELISGNLSVDNITVLELADINNLIVSGITTFYNTVGFETSLYAQSLYAQDYYGPLRFGQPDGGFKEGAIEIQEDDYTKNSINDINFILGKLVPKPPTTISASPFSILNLTSAILCDGFSPINNAGGSYIFSPGSSYPRNTSNAVTSSWLTEYGPGDDGTVTGFLNSVGVGTTTLSVGSNDGVYDSLQIANDKDSSLSSRNVGILSGFYEVYDSRLLNASSPDGFNIAYIRHQVGANNYETQKYLYYEDPSTVSAPSLTVSTPIIPSSPVLNYSSGIPHYTQSSSNAFTYDITCLNATGDMYSNYTFLTSSGQTTGFQNGGNKNYGNFGGSNPPVRNFGVNAGVTGSISQIPRDLHIRVTTDSQKFSLYTASTPYGSDNVRATIPQFVNIMGTTARTNVIDEDNILIQTLGSGSGNARRVNAGSSGDNPSPNYTDWNASSPIATYEATVIGGDLKHDQTNYSTGYLPVGPDYSSGRSGSQYFQLEMIRSNVSEFLIVINGSYSGCWVCMPDNSSWTSSLSGVNGWADMFQTYKGSGIPTTAQPGCAFAGNMTGSTGTFICVFGTESSSNDANNRILVRFKLNSGNQINTLSFRST